MARGTLLILAVIISPQPEINGDHLLAETKGFKHRRTFEQWKAKKDSEMKEKGGGQREKRRREREEKLKREEDCKRVFNAWLEKKEKMAAIERRKRKEEEEKEEKEKEGGKEEVRIGKIAANLAAKGGRGPKTNPPFEPSTGGESRHNEKEALERKGRSRFTRPESAQRGGGASQAYGGGKE